MIITVDFKEIVIPWFFLKESGKPILLLRELEFLS